jgi:hypothetical protein
LNGRKKHRDNEDKNEVAPGKFHARQPVKTWRLHMGKSQRTDRVVALLVSHDQDDVWSFSLDSRIHRNLPPG